jgi:acyl dehydratase
MTIQVGHRLAEITKDVTQDQVQAYAEAAGDFNPIHLDERYAAGTQFGRRIAHGMLVLAFVSEMMSTAFPREWPSTGRLKTRLRAPVYPGENVRVTGEAVAATDEPGRRWVEYRIAVIKPDGSEAVSGQAFVAVKPA